MFVARNIEQGRGAIEPLVTLARRGWHGDAAKLVAATASYARAPSRPACTLAAGRWQLGPRRGTEPRDPALDCFDLAVSRLTDSVGAPSRRQVAATLLTRSGLLLRILDLAHAHLKPRQSGGIPTMRHQLIKETFVSCHSLAMRVQAVTPERLAAGLCAADLHEALTDGTCAAAKLTGGHAMLRGGAHALEFLSLSFAAFGGADDTGGRRGAAA